MSPSSRTALGGLAQSVADWGGRVAGRVRSRTLTGAYVVRRSTALPGPANHRRDLLRIPDVPRRGRPLPGPGHSRNLGWTGETKTPHRNRSCAMGRFGVYTTAPLTLSGVLCGDVSGRPGGEQLAFAACSSPLSRWQRQLLTTFTTLPDASGTLQDPANIDTHRMSS